jgi:hypothetical protein
MESTELVDEALELLDEKLAAEDSGFRLLEELLTRELEKD